MKCKLNHVFVTPGRAIFLKFTVILFLLFIRTSVSAQSFILYQLPSDAGYSWEKLNKELEPLRSLAEVEKSINAKIPKFTGELIVLAHIKGSPPFLWIMNEAKKVSQFRAPMLGDQPGVLKNLSDLEKVYFKDTIIVMDSLLIDITEAADFSRYNFNQFYFRTSVPQPASKAVPAGAKADAAKKNGTTTGSASASASNTSKPVVKKPVATKIYHVPNNQYKKLNIKQSIFGQDIREYVDVELFNVLLPDKIYGRCYIYFPSQAFKADLLKKARFLRDNADFTLPDITGVVSMDLQRRGTLYYKPLLNWLRSQLASRK